MLQLINFFIFILRYLRKYRNKWLELIIFRQTAGFTFEDRVAAPLPEVDIRTHCPPLNIYPGEQVI